MFSHFCAGSGIRTNFLIRENLGFLPKKFITLTSRKNFVKLRFDRPRAIEPNATKLQFFTSQ